MKSFQHLSQFEIGVKVRAYSGLLGALLILGTAALPYLLKLPAHELTPFVSLALATGAGYLLSQSLELLNHLHK